MAGEDGVIISWNATNWITIILMAAIGFTLLGFVSKWVSNKRNQNANS